MRPGASNAAAWRRSRWMLALLGTACAHAPTATVPPARAPNVVFVAVDDLRPLLGGYGAPAKTPNLDALLADGARFEHAYCQQSVCGPSRASLLTGRRPESTGVHRNVQHFRDALPSVLTLPQFFKQHGWVTESLAKVFHVGYEDHQSWSVREWFPDTMGYDDTGPSMSAPDVPDERLQDGQVAAHAVAELWHLRDRPFFLAIGFSKPHLPFNPPRRYWDLYPEGELPLANNPQPPDGVPAIALTDSGELRGFSDIPKQGPIPEAKARELVRGYYASVSFMDAQIGKVLRALDETGLRERTIVVVWGDHGFHLGEHGLWCKSTNFEVAARAPLIVRAPGRRRGVRIDALVELVDVYPTLAELAGLPRPEGLEGTSFAPLLDDPDRPWKSAAFTEHPRSLGEVMGRSMRTARFRYTEWAHGAEVIGRELYDHERDPEENVNIATRPDSAATVAELAAKLHAGWRAALPPR